MIKNYLFIVCLGLLSLFARDVLAVTAVPWPVVKTQPDGTSFSVYLRGDEKVHWMESPDGYTLMYDDQKYVVYAKLDARGNLTPSGVRYGSKLAPQAAFPKGLRYSEEQVNALKQIWEIVAEPQDRQRSSGQQRVGATVGERKALCVLAGFTDKAFGRAKEDYEILFNQVGLAQIDPETKGSVRDFFYENSYGKLDFTVTLVGPYTAPNTALYYASHEREFAAFAAQAADADVDYNDFDGDDNGALETFHILFAGYGDEAVGSGEQIWSHKWQLAAPLTLDGVNISVYSCSPELRGSSGNDITYIGVVCHELSHVFGAPDYYDTSYSGFGGTGNWDLMANGSWNDDGRQPAHINIFQKILYGWVDPVELTAQTAVDDMLPSATSPTAYTIRVNDNGELYVLDNRQKVGFDASLPGHGLLVWHVHPAALGGSGSNSGHPQQLYPVVASSTVAIPNSSPASYGSINSGGTPFPGTSGNRSFTAKSTPAMFTWTGLQTVAKPVTEIVESADGKVSFNFLDGPTEPLTGLEAAVEGNNVTLSWTPPARNDVRGYRIFRDGAQVYASSDKNKTSYTQIGVPKGSYEYCVAVVYEVTESGKACVQATVASGNDEYYLPVTDLQATAGIDRVNLSWTAPFNGGWTGIAGDYAGAYYFGYTWDFFAGTLWNPSDLKGLNGYRITKVKFIPIESLGDGATYAVAVYEVPASGEPVPLQTQNVSGTLDYTGVYNEVSLDIPVTIDASKGVIVGMQVHTVGGDCLPVSQGDAYPGRNVFYDADGWCALEDIGVGLGDNYCLQVYIEAASGSPALPEANIPANTSFLKKDNRKQVKAGERIATGSPGQAPASIATYTIYRDGLKVGSSATTSYQDTGLSPETAYSYCVSVEYSDGGVSESVCLELTTDMLFKPVSKLKAQVVADEVRLSWEPQYTYLSLFEEDFEGGIPAEWTTVDEDKDGFFWEVIGTGIPSHSGNRSVSSASYDYVNGNVLTPDNWLVTPAITLTGNNKLSYYVNAQDADYAAEHYGVYISTSSNIVPNDFSLLFEETMKASPGKPDGNPVPGFSRSGGPQYLPGAWYERMIDLSAYEGQTVYLAFRHFDCTDQYLLNLDDARIVAPVSVGSITYNVYEGSQQLAAGLTSPQYVLSHVEAGTHSYCVTAVYNGTDRSESVCVDATVASLGDLHRPVSKLEARMTEPFKGELSWNAPVYAAKLRRHSFDDGTFGAVGTNLAVDFDIVARWLPEDLTKLDGLMLTKVRFIPVLAKAITSYSVRVWVGGSNPSEGVYEPGEMVADQLIPEHTANQWNEIPLNAPVPIDPARELWIGIRCNTASGRPAPYQNVNTLDGKGNLLYFDGEWITLREAGIEGNWIIDGVAAYHQGLDPVAALQELPVAARRASAGTLAAAEVNAPAGSFSEAPPAIPAVEKYVVSRDGEDIGETTATSFADEVPAATSYAYCVRVVYNDGGLSSAACADLRYVKELTIAGASVGAKTYDGTREGTVESVAFVDAANAPVSLTMGADYTATAEFDDANAGTGRTVTVTVALLNESYALSESTFQLSGRSIGKGIPAYTVPRLTALEGQTLHDLALPQGWAWDEPGATLVGAAGTNEHPATYTPDDPANYETVGAVPVPIVVTVTPAREVTIAASENGRIASDKIFAEENDLVTLTALPDAGYEVSEVKVSRSDDGETTVAVTALSALDYTFTMPPYAVTVQAAFRKTDARVLAEIKAQIEAETYTVDQATANTEVQVANRLARQINALIRPTGLSVSAGDVSFSAFRPAVEGSESVPDGTDGSFVFAVGLSLNSASATTADLNGAIIARTYTPPVVPQEVFYYLTIPEAEGIVIDWPAGLHEVSEYAYVTITFRAAEGYSLDELTVYVNGAARTLSAGSDGVWVLELGYLSGHVGITIKGQSSPVGLAAPQSAVLKAQKADGGLYVSGLKPGAEFRIYHVSGSLVYRSKAVATEEFVSLPERGFYIIVAEGSSLKLAL